jgi:hypothetical protein
MLIAAHETGRLQFSGAHAALADTNAFAVVSRSRLAATGSSAGAAIGASGASSGSGVGSVVALASMMAAASVASGQSQPGAGVFALAALRGAFAAGGSVASGNAQINSSKRAGSGALCR